MLNTEKNKGIEDRILYGSLLLEKFGKDKFDLLAQERECLLKQVNWDGDVILNIAKTKGEIQSICVRNKDNTAILEDITYVSAFLIGLSEFKYKDDFMGHCVIEFTLDNNLTKVKNINISAIKDNNKIPKCTLSGEKLKLKLDKNADGFFEGQYFYIFTKDIPKDSLVYFTLNFILKASIKNN